MRIGYHAPHEQYPPSQLLSFARLAEQGGFEAAMCSDHLTPFLPDQGHSGFTWTWLGAAMERTSLTFGTVNAPGQRYHPVIIAQAIATLAEMYPGRFWVALGSGHHVNEYITGGTWLPKRERQERLLECVGIIRSLLAGDTVEHYGHVSAVGAKLWVRPKQAVELVGAAIQVPTARWVGSWADAMITVAQPPEQLRQMIEAFREGGGEGKPVYVQVQLSYAASEEAAREAARREWRSALLAPETLEDMPTPEHVEGATMTVRAEDMDASVHIATSPEQVLDWLASFGELGFEAAYVHNVNRNQEEFIEMMGKYVLPELRKR